MHHRSDQNVDRLLSVLEKLNARYRSPRGTDLRPSRSHLLSEGHQLLITDNGPLDLLGSIGKGNDYDDLISHSVEMDVGQLTLHVLDLETLIEIKEELGQPKDKAVLPILRATLEEQG